MSKVMKAPTKPDKVTDYLVYLAGVGAPLVNLIALDNRSWPYIAWLVAGSFLATMYVVGRRR